MKTKYKIIISIFVLVQLILNINISLGQDLRSVLFCDTYSETVSSLTYEPSTGKCYVDVTYSLNYTLGGNTTQLPYGIDAAVDGQAQITSMLHGTGFPTWSSYTPFTASEPNAKTICGFPFINDLSPVVPFFPLNTMGWKSNIPIPSSSVLKFRVYIDMHGQTTTKLWLRVLNGGVINHPGESECYYECQKVYMLNQPSNPYTLSADATQLCIGDPATNHTILRINPLPPTGSTITWYSVNATALGLPGGCPQTSPMDPSSLWLIPSPGWPQTGTANWCPTNSPSQTTCYIAVIKSGCYTYTSNPLQITVCPSPNSIIGLTCTPNPLYNIVQINGVNHVCNKWQGELSFTNPGVCNFNAVWEISTNGGTTFNTAFSGAITSFPFPTYTFSGSGCNNTYIFRANITLQCGTTTQVITRTFTIVIDKPTTPGTITASPFNLCGTPCPITCDAQHPVLCFNRATQLTYTGGCGDIVKWESSTSATGPWTPVAGKTSSYNTNKMTQTTFYKVTVKNGACDDSSRIIKVVVKPHINATLATLPPQVCTMICPPGNSCNLIATSPSYDLAGYAVQYTWYKDGILIQAQSSDATFTATEPGNYYVIATDITCGSNVKSNIIKVCKPELIITGSCGICPSGNDNSVTMEAEIKGGCECSTGYTYEWRLLGNPTPILSSSPSYSINYADITGPSATYEVTVKCGTCCTLKAKHTISKCK